MFLRSDPDEYEVVIEHRPCTACHGDRLKCRGQCNGMSSYGTRRRPDAEIAALKLKRRIAEEDAILVRAEAIKRSRGLA